MSTSSTILFILLSFLTALTSITADVNFFHNMTVLEELAVGSLIGQVGAGLDLPPGAGPPYQVYSTQLGPVGVSTSGEVTVQGRMDREQKSVYQFIAISQSSVVVQVTVTVYVLDINDNSPVFSPSSVSVSIPESAPITATFNLATATDLDLGNNSIQRCQIVSGNSDSTFRILTTRTSTGSLTIQLGLNRTLNYEAISSYSLVIRGYDGGSPSRTTDLPVQINVQDVNDNSPIFNQSIYHARIPENTPIGKNILQVFAFDADSGENGRITYSLDPRQGSGNSDFNIDPTTGVISTRVSLNYSTRPSYVMVVIAEDGGVVAFQMTSVVTIDVTRSADSNPVIHLEFFSDDGTPSIQRSAAPGSLVAHISVTDPDYPNPDPSIVNITLVGGGQHFALRRTGAVIYLMVVASSLEDAPSTITMTIIATIGTTIVKSSVVNFTIAIVPENSDSVPPQFSQTLYYGSIPQSSPVGTSVVQLGIVGGPPNVKYVYRIRSKAGSRYDWFHIDRGTGLITTSARFDCLTVGEYTLTVTAKNSTTAPVLLTTSVLIHITSVTRHPPEFTSGFYHTALPEDSLISTSVLQVVANGPGCGNNRISYQISSDGSTILPFSMNEQSGTIFVSGSLISSMIYEFDVSSTDQAGYQSMALVQVSIIPVNSQPPTFNPTQYMVLIDMNLALGSAVAVVKATDVNNGIVRHTYQFANGNTGSTFAINATSGLISISRLLSLQPRQFSLSVMAVDVDGLSSDLSVARINVTVFDPVTWPAPAFTSTVYAFQVMENATIGTVIGAVGLVTPSTFVELSVVGSDLNVNLFRVDSATGQITTVERLDRETTASVLLTVRAQNTHNTSLYTLAQVNITVLDVNDNSPQFSVSTTVISVYEDIPINTLLYIAQATDIDSNLNSQLQYNVSNPTFSVNPKSGEILLRRELDFETLNHHVVMVTASDLGRPSRTSTLTLVVNVYDANDNFPVFSSSAGYSFRLLRPVPLGGFLGAVNATDLDSGDNSRLTYYLRNGRFADLFDVRSSSGEIYAKTVLGPEAPRRFLLQIVACDGGVPTLSTTTQVLITLYNNVANGTLPAFVLSDYQFSVTENQPAMTSVGVVSAVGVETPNYIMLSQSSEFMITAASGEILTTGLLDREERESYRLVVGVRSGNTAVTMATAYVTVSVLDLNDNSPVFTSVFPRVVHIAEGSPIGTSLVQLTATDRDSGPAGIVTYYFAPDNNRPFSSYFSLNATSGLIRTRQVLNRGTLNEFTLKILATDSGDPPRVSSPLIIQICVDDLADPDNEPPSTITASFTVSDSVESGTILGYIDSHQTAATNYYIERGNTFASFGLNLTSGALYVALPINYDDTPTFSIHVIAVDSVSVSRHILVNITVLNDRVGIPVFDSDLIFINLREDVPTGRTVTKLSASYDGGRTDVDFSITSVVPNATNQKYFVIDRKTGVLTTSGMFDRETVPQITVVVMAMTASSGAVKQRNSTATVVVMLTDVNDNAPLFESPAVVNVTEDVVEGYAVLTVVATDPDLGDNGRVTYSLSCGNEAGHFQLDSESGLLSVVRSLDRETISWYQLNISATDHGRPSLASTFLLTIYVADVNDNIPVFTQRSYSASVLEEQVPPVAVTTVSATDFDDPTTMNVDLTYMIPAGVANNNFVINPKTGVISTNRTLDREIRDTWILTVYVHNAGFPSLYDTTTVYITIVDINDNSPVFVRLMAPLTLEVPENANMAAVHTVEASDADVGDNGRVTYSITGGNVDGRFYISADTGQLSCSPLDREQTPTYNLSITATDSAPASPAPSDSAPTIHASMHSTTIQIVIRVVDDNDNDPIFDRPAYSAVFPEDVMLGFSVLTLVATDLDDGLNANVTYTLSSAADGMFEVNALTGLITTTGYFDREAISSYSFDAIATDSCPYGPRSRSVRVDVTLTDVNDNAPVFSQSVYYVDMEIGLRVDPNVLTVSATDSDVGRNANITYALSNASTLFQIDPVTGAIQTLYTFGVSEVGPHTLKVIARDAGIPSLNATCSVVIRVERVSPSTQLLRFVNDTYTTSIPEHSIVGTTVLTVTARWNGSSPVSYSLANGDDIFYINPNTGVISVANSAKLDYETSARLRLIVFATTATTSTSIAHDYTTVWINVVDINDNVPRFTQQRYQTSVWEGNLPDTYVTQVMATDADTNAVIMYDIVAGNTQSAFAIFPPNSGILLAKLVLDREIQDSYRLEIRAYNPDTPDKYATAFLRIQVVDVNDNAPYFPSYNPVQVHESLPAGSLLLQVTANDIDLNPMLTYTLLSANNVFAIDKYSGKISTIKQLDYETDRGYSLNILVSDVLHNATRSVQVVVIDDNDNAPVFTQSQYQASVDELTGPGVNVLTVSATDRDTADNGRITYTMLQLDSFSIDHNTGVITTARQLVFNANQPAVHLVVTATDHGTPALSTTIAVEVQVVDVNDHAPVFTLPAYSVSVSENEVTGSTLLRLTATDADFTFDNTKLEFTMTSGNSDDCFMVIASTGELLLVAQLDRERMASYSLTVGVADNGQPALTSTTQVYVSVQDVNDNSPVFNQSQYNVTVREDISVNSHIVTLCAVDRDVTDVGRVVYSIVTGDGVDNFTIDSHSGVLSVKSALDYETKSTYSLVVSAVDSGSTPHFTAFTEVNIQVTDVNEHRPTFPVLFYYEIITENQPNGTLVFTAQASDKDGGQFGVVRYQLSANFPTDLPPPFVIEPDTGNVRSNAVFNYSVDSILNFQFRVIATDAGGLNTSVSVLVVVQKELAALQFTQTNYEFKVRNDAHVGDTIGQVRVLLPPNSNAVVTYSLRPEDEHFGINRTTGIIYIIKDLNDWSEKNGIKWRRRRRSLEAVNLHVVASSGLVEGYVDVRVMVNRTAVILPETTLQPPGTTSPHSAGLTGVRLIIAIVLPCIAVVVVAVVLVVYFRRRKIKSPLNDRNGIGGHSTEYSSSLETFDVPPPPAFKGFRPPPYPEIPGGGVFPRAGVHATTSEMTGEDDGVESSGRGSAEKGADDLDDEIRMINRVQGAPLSSSQARRNNANNPQRVPDSGIQPDHYDEDLASETSDQRNNRACLQRLGVDVSGMGRPRRVGGAMGSGAPSVESMHQFSEEGGGEASGIELNDYKIRSGDNNKPAENSNRSSRRQSFDPIIDADLVLGTSYNWDYLLNWKPEYRPLAEVFAEIARLPDETANRRPPVKTIPTQIVPQRPANQRLVGGAPRGGHRDGPPPIITGAPPRSVRLERESSSSACSTTSSSRLQALSVPRSALTYESSFMMSPARTPSMSPAVTCSPSVSPVDRSSTHSRTPIASRPLPPGNKTAGRRCSEQEIQI